VVGQGAPVRSIARGATAPPLLLIALLLACDGDAPGARTYVDSAPPAEDAAPVPSPLDACALLTRDEVADVLGATPGDAIVGMNEPGDEQLAQVSQCTWPAQGAERTLSLLVRRAPTDQNTPAAIDQVRETLRSAGLTLEDADGPGDVTFWTGTELHVFRGQREYVTVGLTGFDDRAAALAAARRAALHVIDRL
jgi:hypothetical protein